MLYAVRSFDCESTDGHLQQCLPIPVPGQNTAYGMHTFLAVPQVNFDFQAKRNSQRRIKAPGNTCYFLIKLNHNLYTTMSIRLDGLFIINATTGSGLVVGEEKSSSGNSGLFPISLSGIGTEPLVMLLYCHRE